MLNIALFGPPGAGKGTQSPMLVARYGLFCISTGDLLRTEMRNGTDLGLAAKDVIAKGGLVPDEIIVQILEKTISENPQANGFLFDGFPRTWVQAYILEGLLLKMHTSLMALISLEVPDRVCTERLLGRAVNSGRIDDKHEVIEVRLREYNEKTAPVLGFYAERGIHKAVDGLGTVDEIFDRVTNVIDLTLESVQMNVVLLGGPGSGRGTQAQRLAAKHNLTILSAGDLLQEEIRRGSPVGQQVFAQMEEGSLVPDEVVIRLVEERIKSNKGRNGFIFKGFPRTLVQAYILDGLLRKAGSQVNCVLDLRVPTIELVRRLSARGRHYDLATATIFQRLHAYEHYENALSSYYGNSGRLHVIDGVGSLDEVFLRMSKPIDEAFRLAR
jgi:adenylate kinase